MSYVTGIRRAATVLASLLLLLALGSCSQSAGNPPESSTGSADAPNTDPVDIHYKLSIIAGIFRDTPMIDTPDKAVSEDPGALSAYRAVLLGDADYLTPWNNTYHSVDEDIEGRKAINSNPTMIFSVIDLDSDGIPEVVLWSTWDARYNDNASGFLVLHYQDGIVYGYGFYYRGFEDLKTDGTFSYSGGAPNHGIGIVDFNDAENSYTHAITYCKSTDRVINGYRVEDYYVDGMPATEECFFAAIAQQEDKPDVTWHYFTKDDILTAFPDD